MFFGQTITFTNPIFNKDRTKSLTSPDNPISYTTSAPHSGNAFIWDTQTGARGEVSKLALAKFWGFNVDSYGNPIQVPVQAEALPVNYYTIYEIPEVTKIGYSLSNLMEALRSAGFAPTAIYQSTTANVMVFEVPYISEAEKALIVGAENDYKALVPVPTSNDWVSVGPPLPPGSVTPEGVIPTTITPTVPITHIPTITVPNISTAQVGLQGLLNMKVFGISAPLVVGGALLVLLFLRR